MVSDIGISVNVLKDEKSAFGFDYFALKFPNKGRC